jgi:hypothetical protein
MKKYIEPLYEFILKAELRGKIVKDFHDLPPNLFPDPNIKLAQAALRAKFNKEFTEEEVSVMLKEEYGYHNGKTLEQQGEELIPQWYKDKWFK